MIINIAGGTGIMGQVHEKVFEKAGHDVIISGRTTTPGLEYAARMSDVTIVSVPIPATKEIIQRVAPHASCLMDFTGLKVFPIETMLEYSKDKCEVTGLHPLYKDLNTLEGRTVVVCKTERTGEKSEKVLDAFREYGIKLKPMEAKEHDLYVGGIAQNARMILLQAFGLLVQTSGLSMKEFYEISPPPTRILLDLLARQVDTKNDELFGAMLNYNGKTESITRDLYNNLKTSSESYDPKKIRDFFGEEFLKAAQERARLIIEKS